MRRDGAENRERILAAAEDVFAAGGATASTEEVARRADVGVATVFRHFPTKKDLLETTAVRYMGKLADEARRLTEAEEPEQAFGSLIVTLVSTGATKTALIELVPRDASGTNASLVSAVEDFREAVRQVLERAQNAGAVRSDTTVEEVFVLVRALAHVATPEQSRAVERAVRIVLDGLGASRALVRPP